MPTREHAPLALCLAALLAAAPSVLASDLSVERLELLSHGAYEDGSFSAATRLYFDLAIKGGDKFGGLLRMNLLSGSIEDSLGLSEEEATSANYLDKLNNLASPVFKTAAVTAKSILGLPFDLSYFVGSLDTFASGDDFVSLFGTENFSTALRGPMVYPEGVGGNENLFYDGIYEVDGTGFKLGTGTKLSERIAAYLYLYQDANLGTGRWSGDLRALYNAERVKVEAFAGASTAATYGAYRAGILFFAAPGDVGEFLLQAGIPYWDPASSFSVDNLFFLFEPRINFGFGNIALTVFYHPLWYHQQKFDGVSSSESEKSALDAAFNLRLGRLAQAGMQGGAETLLKFRPLTDEPLSVDISPYYSMISGGIEWDFKLSLRTFPLPSPWYGMFKPFIGLKTSF
jgi:hypothetical protein